MVALMLRRRRRRRPVRPRLGIRRRKPPADLWRRRRAGQRQSVPDWKNFLPAFQSPPHNTVNGVHYGISFQWGPNTLHLQHEGREAGAHGWSSIYARSSRARSPFPTTDPDRRCGALSDEDEAEPRDQGSVRADPRGNSPRPSPCSSTEGAAEAILGLRRHEIKGLQVGRPGHRRRLAVPDPAPCRQRRCRSRRLIPKEGATGWADTWMLAEGARTRIARTCG